jgi:hypothetical protein
MAATPERNWVWETDEQAELLNPIEGDPEIWHTIGHQEVASLDPTFFVQTP